MILPDRSLMRLVGVHSDLVHLVLWAATNSSVPFIVTEGLRTKERQATLVSEGKSRTLNSRHITGHAVDLAVSLPDGGVSWKNSDYKMLAMNMAAASEELGIPIDWGGECFGPSFIDSCHWQLPWKFYPAPVPNLNPDGEVTKT